MFFLKLRQVVKIFWKNMLKIIYESFDIFIFMILWRRFVAVGYTVFPYLSSERSTIIYRVMISRIAKQNILLQLLMVKWFFSRSHWKISSSSVTLKSFYDNILKYKYGSDIEFTITQTDRSTTSESIKMKEELLTTIDDSIDHGWR